MNNKELTLEKRQKVAEIIKEAREEKKITQEKLAELVGCARSTIIRIENGVFSPNADQLYVILDALDLKLKIDDIEI